MPTVATVLLLLLFPLSSIVPHTPPPPPPSPGIPRTATGSSSSIVTDLPPQCRNWEHDMSVNPDLTASCRRCGWALALQNPSDFEKYGTSLIAHLASHVAEGAQLITAFESALTKMDWSDIVSRFESRLLLLCTHGVAGGCMLFRFGSVHWVRYVGCLRPQWPSDAGTTEPMPQLLRLLAGAHHVAAFATSQCVRTTAATARAKMPSTWRQVR